MVLINTNMKMTTDNTTKKIIIVLDMMINMRVNTDDRLRRPFNFTSSQWYTGRDRAAKMPARNMAIRKDRIIDRNTAEINTTRRITAKLFTF